MLQACAPGTANTLFIVSNGDKSVFAPNYQCEAYLATDPNTAELYLSDIPASRLTDSKDTLDTARGSIIHIHLFLYPSAGSTPVDPTACNITIRQLVLAGPATGLYGGGGFVLPDGDIGDKRVSGTIRQASVRMIRSTADFHDPIGPGSLSGEFSTPRNDALAKTISARIDSLLARLPPPATGSAEDTEMENSLRLKAKPDAQSPDSDDAPPPPKKSGPSPPATPK